jgi:hypothetical protein
MRRQCAVLHIARSGVYRPKAAANDNDLTLMRRIDALYLQYPFLVDAFPIRRVYYAGEFRRGRRDGAISAITGPGIAREPIIAIEGAHHGASPSIGLTVALSASAARRLTLAALSNGPNCAMASASSPSRRDRRIAMPWENTASIASGRDRPDLAAEGLGKPGPFCLGNINAP